MRSPVNSSIFRFGTSAAFLDEEPVCLLDRPRVHIPKKPSSGWFSGLEVINKVGGGFGCVSVCVCMCATW